MRRILVLFSVLLFIGKGIQAQELSCRVIVDAQQTGRTQLSVFNTLQRSIEDFLNETKWTTGPSLPEAQRVKCNFFITVQKYSSNFFESTLQIQSSRPVYNTSLNTPVFNHKDGKFNFSYEEGQALRFNPNTYENNLVSTLAFYVNVMLGLDADTFAPNAGTSFFDQADQIASIAEQGGSSGWGSSSGANSRYELNQQLKSSAFQDFHEALYVYHRHGLDRMYEDMEEGKRNIGEAIGLLDQVFRSRSNTLLIRSFFDAKANEIADVFKGGPSVPLDNLIQNLNNMAPGHSSIWNEIK